MSLALLETRRNISKKTDGILNNMLKRRLMNGNPVEYHQINKNIRRVCRKAKEYYCNSKFEEIRKI